MTQLAEGPVTAVGGAPAGGVYPREDELGVVLLEPLHCRRD